MKYWLATRRKGWCWLGLPEGSMSGNQSLFCHRRGKNGDSWMASWLRCWKSPGWEGELLRTLVSPDWHWECCRCSGGPLSSMASMDFRTLWIFSSNFFSQDWAKPIHTHCNRLCLRHQCMPLNDTWGKTLSFFFFFFCSACLFLSEWFILNKFLAQCLFLQP